jgi:hypothetical protein
MGDHARSSRCQALFESTLQEYKKKTDITLAEHELALQLRGCRSVESITSLLQDQLRTSNNLDVGGTDGIMIAIKSTISIVSTLSATAAFDWAIGFVSQKALLVAIYMSHGSFQTFSPENAINAGLAILLAVCPLLRFLCAYRCDIHLLDSQGRR